jgi:hypothetical protein
MIPSRVIPSPAMAVAVVALVFATTGAARAAVGLLPNPLPLQKPPTTVSYSKTFTAANAQAFASAELHCPAGERLLGGSTGSQDSGHFVWSSQPITAGGQLPQQGQTPTGWAGSISTPDGHGGGTVTVAVLCERPTP